MKQQLAELCVLAVLSAGAFVVISLVAAHPPKAFCAAVGSFSPIRGEDTKRNLKHVKDRAANLADANRTLTFLGSKCVPLGRNADYSAK